jgi:hypothetical protein
MLWNCKEQAMKKSGIAKSPASSRSKGLASEATDKRRGANSPSSNTQRTRGSAPKTADFDPTSRPQRAAASKGVGTKSGAAGEK